MYLQGLISRNLTQLLVLREWCKRNSFWVGVTVQHTSKPNIKRVCYVNAEQYHLVASLRGFQRTGLSPGSLYAIV